jgi:flagellar motility protein MotE (MotC chaperone)
MKKFLAMTVVLGSCTLAAQTLAADAKPPASASGPMTKASGSSDGDAELARLAHNAARDAAAAEGSAVPPGCPVCPVRSTEEMDVLMALRERHAELTAREAVLKRRESAVAELEKTLDHKVAQLDGKMDKLEERLNLGDPGRAQREKRISTLVGTLTGLTAKKAAPILVETDPEVAAELMQRMDVAKAAALLAIMPAQKAGQFISLGIGQLGPKKTSAQPPAAQAGGEASP